MNTESVVNMTDKPLSEFKDGDSLYIQKMPGGSSGHIVDLLCVFRGLYRGVVTADVVSVEPDWAGGWVGKRITAVAEKCYLWGVGEGEINPRCHWFKSSKGRAE